MTPRARDLGISIGSGTPGPLNAITDVPGVRVGHRTVVRGGDGDPHAVRTGVTAMFPHEGHPWREWVYAGVDILNGYGELIGVNQLREWGVLMSPIVLTSSLQIGKAYDATVRWIAGRDPIGAEEVMPVVSECDDSWLSDVLSFPLADDDVAAALDAAAAGSVEEGNVGAGTGMQCFDFKGGIGTASRVLDDDERRVHGRRPRAHELRQSRASADRRRAGRTGTDRPDAARAPRGIVRSRGRHRCAPAAAPAHPHRPPGGPRARRDRLTRLERQRRADDGLLDVEPPRCERGDRATCAPWSMGRCGTRYALSALFRATVEATEEAVVNALVAADDSVGRDGHTYFAMPVDRVLESLDRAGRLSH